MTDVVRTQAEFLTALKPLNNHYAQPFATVWESQLARDFIVSLPQINGLNWFIIDGSPYAKTGAGVRAAMAAAASAGGGVIYVPPNTTIQLDTTSITWASNDIYIISDPSATWLLPSGATANITVFLCQGTASSSVALNANMTKGLKYVPVTTTNSLALQAAGMAVGSLVAIFQNLTDPADPDSDKFCAEVVSIDDSAAPNSFIYVSVPAPKNYLTASSANIQLLVPRKNCGVIGVTADGNGNTATQVDLINRTNVQNFITKDIRATNIQGAVVGSSGYTYNSLVENVTAFNCGNSNGIMAVEETNPTLSYYTNVRLTACYHAMDIRGASYCQLDGLFSGGAVGRGLKFHHARGCSINNAQGFNSLTLSGISVSGDSADNVFTNLQGGGNFEAFITLTQVPAGTNVVRDNQFLSIDAGSGNGNPNVDILTSGPNITTLNTFDGRYAFVSDSGTKNIFQGFRRDVAFNAGNFTASGGAAWTLTSPDQAQYSYYLEAHGNVVKMTVYVDLDATSVTVGPATLSIALPGGWAVQAASRCLIPIRAIDNLVPLAAYALANPAATTIILALAAGNWAVSANQTSVSFVFEFWVG